MKKKTGISYSDTKFDWYLKWLERGEVEYVVLDYRENNFQKINECSSLLLTGGADVFPEFYSDWDSGSEKDDYKPERDGFEFKLLDHALEKSYPVLAICRGMQLLNCRLNGNLISDLETVRNTVHKKISNTEDRMHAVNIKENTLLFDVVGEKDGIVNSSHHQAIDRPGEGLVFSAKADDGIIEAVEWSDSAARPFLLGVQWHPERMAGMASPFSDNILKRFRDETLRS